MRLLSLSIYVKLSCDKFLEKLKNYVSNNFKHAEIAVCVPTGLKDPTKNFDSKFMPININED